MQSERFIGHHQGRPDDSSIFGQERSHTTYRLARTNLAIRDIFADIRWNQEGALKRDVFPNERFDYALANPRKNARTKPLGRAEMTRRIVDDGRLVSAVAVGFWIIEQTVEVARLRAAEVGEPDRHSRGADDDYETIIERN